MYKHLFFDLDHTLWDFDKNSNETLAEMHAHFGMHKAVALEHFVQTFLKVNVHLWEKHNANLIDQQTLRLTRFPLVFEAMGVNMPAHSEELSAMYLDLMPRKAHTMPHAIEVLDYLKPKYALHIITNGFPEIQDLKLSSAGITDYFELVVTSAQAGCRKPAKEMFDYTMNVLNVPPHECLMIGDNWEADIEGARKAGIDQVFSIRTSIRLWQIQAFIPRRFIFNRSKNLLIFCNLCTCLLYQKQSKNLAYIYAGKVVLAVVC